MKPKNYLITLLGEKYETTNNTDTRNYYDCKTGYKFNSRFPDLIIGLVISIIVIRGGIHIIKDAKNEN